MSRLCDQPPQRQRLGSPGINYCNYINIGCFVKKKKLHLNLRSKGPGILGLRPIKYIDHLKWNKQIIAAGLNFSYTPERMINIYGSKVRFRMKNHPDGGLILAMQIPVETRKRKNETITVSANREHPLETNSNGTSNSGLEKE